MIFILNCFKHPGLVLWPKMKNVLTGGWRQMTLPPSGVPFAMTPTRGTEGPDLVLTVRVCQFDVVGSDPSQKAVKV